MAMNRVKFGHWPRRALGAALVAVAALTLAAADQDRAHKNPVLIELFTSQGCASCPKANAFLGQLSHEPNTIALTYPVGYWDYLGWKDTFAKPEFAERQKSYAAIFKRGVYTPQMVVDGEAHTNALRPPAVRRMFEQVRMLGGVKVKMTREGGKATVALHGATPGQAADIWLIQYAPGPIYVQVKGGENAGMRMPHYNLVTQLSSAGAWTGGAKQVDLACEPACAVIVQEKQTGRVLAAKMLAPGDQGVAAAGAPSGG